MKIRKVGLYCGERLFSLESWRRLPLFRKLRTAKGFSIGPILFWDGS